MIRTTGIKHLYTKLSERDLQGRPIFRGSDEEKGMRPMNPDEVRGALFALRVIQEHPGFTFGNGVMPEVEGEKPTKKAKKDKAGKKVKKSSKE